MDASQIFKSREMSRQSEPEMLDDLSQMGGVYQRFQPGARLCRLPNGVELILHPFNNWDL